MSCANEYIPELRLRGFRVTAQRMAVLHVLRHSGLRLTPAEVYWRARQELPGLTETTVYRTLHLLARQGFAWPTRMDDKGHLLYEIAGRHHHHLICRLCGAEIEVEHALMQSLYTKLEAASGYHLADEHITLFGLCPDCQKPNVRKRG